MKKIARFALVAAASLAAVSFASAAGSSEKPGAAAAKQTVVKIGLVGEKNDQWVPVVEALAKEGIKIELVKFSDYTQPNQALADKEIDLNAFQHIAFLNNDKKTRGLDLTAIGKTVIAPLGLYSKKIKAVAELKDKDKIAIPNDATNGGRALRLLESAGLIKIRAESGFLPTQKDIVENRLNLEIIEVEAAQTPRLLPDVAASVINGGHAVDAGFTPSTDAVFLEKVLSGSDNPYVNVIVARTADKDNAVYKKVVAAYQTDAVAGVIKTAFRGSYIPAWK